MEILTKVFLLDFLLSILVRGGTWKKVKNLHSVKKEMLWQSQERSLSSRIVIVGLN